MTLTIELTPEMERRVRTIAAASGKSVQDFLLDVLSNLPAAPPPSEHEVTAALFQQWADEDKALTPEEMAREDADWQQIEDNLKASRLTLPIPEV
jgi:hypothetical protein